MHNILAAELMKLKKNKMAGTGTLLLCAIPVLAMIKKILIDKDSIGLQEPAVFIPGAGKLLAL